MKTDKENMESQSEFKEEKQLMFNHNSFFELPPLCGLKKQLNQSPRRRIITLKLPKVELSSKDTHYSGFPLSLLSQNPDNRKLSMSVDCRLKEQSLLSTSPLKSKINNYQLFLEDSSKLKHRRARLSSLQVRLKRKMAGFKGRPTKTPSKENILIQGQAKPSKEPINVLPVNENSLFCVGKNFRLAVESKFLSVFEEVDINKTGVIVLDDFINLVIFRSLKEGEKHENYFQIKQKSLEMFHLFYFVTGKSKVQKNDFFAVCSVFEYFFSHLQPNDMLKLEGLKMLLEKLEEMKQVFTCYSKRDVVDDREFKSLLACAQVDDIFLILNLLFSEPVNFSRFLLYLPIFLHVHKEVTSNSVLN
jgi:hypothetical protein